MSVSQQREASRRLEDDLEMLRAERVVSNAEKSNQDSMGRSKSMNRSRSRTNAEPIDDFDVGTTPIHEKTKVYQPPENPSTNFAKVFKKIHNSSFLVRYFFYISPLTILLLIPMLFGLLLFKQANVGGVKLFWFGIWLEVVWLTLWAGRVRIFSPRHQDWFTNMFPDYCQMYSLPHGPHLQHLHQQQQEMAGSRKTTRSPCNYFLLVAGDRSFLPTHYEEPPYRWRQRYEKMGEYCE